MTHYAYLFEAKSIQSYLLATNLLKEIVGGSELVETLTGEFLTDVLDVLDVTAAVQFSRRGGGAFYAFSTDRTALERLAQLWSLLVRQYAPDLSFVQAQGSGETAYAAYQQAHLRLLADRNRVPARLPQASPLAQRYRRTGEPATALRDVSKDERRVPIDAATHRKTRPCYTQGRGLVGRCVAEGANYRDWPTVLVAEEHEEDEDRDFPFQEDRSWIALVHADGNGLGQLLMHLTEQIKRRPESYIATFAAFSEAIDTANQAAAQHAVAQVLAPARGKGGLYPARPIVLGGDDLTFIVRADLALPFTEAFLRAFAQTSAVELKKLQQECELTGLPQRLTGCAGIAYAQASQPFHRLHTLAEGLCKHAKKLAKASGRTEVPSSLAFHRVTTALSEDYSVALQHELTHANFRQTLECYALEPNQSLPLLDDLYALQKIVADLPRGGLRQLLGWLGRDTEMAHRHYARWREVMQERASAKLDEFDKYMKKLCQAETDLPFGPVSEQLRRSPLGDVVALRAVSNLSLEQSNQEPVA